MVMPTSAEVRAAHLALERARVREVARYYQPKKRLSREQQTIGDCAEICGGPFNSLEPEDDAPPDDTQALIHDPTLTAFAQLGAFRLNCERSFISIMDGKNQFILAEATRSISLTTGHNHESEEDAIFLGPTALTLQWGVCPHTIQVFTSADASLDIDTPNVYADRNQYVMNDMSAIEQYKTRPYIVNKPYMKFYAEVPMRSPAGYVIGTYCVVDNKPRDGLDKKGFDALNEIAGAIMNHIELVRTQRGLQRAMGMVKGLGRFVDSKAAVNDLMGNTDNDLKFLEERPSLDRTAGRVETMSSNPQSEQNLSDKLAQTSEPSSVGIAPLQTPPSSTGGTFDLNRSKRERKMSATDATNDGEASALTGIKQLFARACFLIREALDLDGAMIVDACFRDIAVDQINPISILPSVEPLRFPGMPNTPVADSDAWLGGSTVREQITPIVQNPIFTEESLPERPEFTRRSSSSELLGVSMHSNTKSGSSIQRVSLSQSTLRGLLSKYRHGHVFEFDEDGSILENSKDAKPHEMVDTPVELEKEKTWIAQLLEVCPEQDP